jgi:6-phosphogluconolactonase
MSTIQFNSFANFAELTETLAAKWLGIIEAAADAPTYFAIAGGTTPAPIYRRLDEQLATRSAISKVKLIATDERWVEDADPQSNEGLFKANLPLSYGKQWQLISLKNAARTPEVAVEGIDERLQQQIPQAFDAILLGMGGDGHIASLFPAQPTEHDGSTCLAAYHPQTKQSRMSLSLSRLLNTKATWLVITGAEKRAVFDNAANTDLPISALLRESTGTIEVFWCP